MAGVVALNILWSGARVVRDSLSGLMDEAVERFDPAGAQEAAEAAAARRAAFLDAARFLRLLDA